MQIKNTLNLCDLSIFGGKRLRLRPMPARLSFDRAEESAVAEVFSYYRQNKRDPGYQDRFEKIYTDNFVHYMGGNGFADALCTGTAALYAALAALRLKPGSRVLVSAITDPGTINAVILNRLVPVLADTMPDSGNCGVYEVESRLNAGVKAILIVHLAGKAAPVDEISAIARKKNIPLIEDCSQAHGASIGKRKVGTFGLAGVFSTMYRKAHSTGGCGGVVLTRNKKFYDLVRAYADRGKPSFKRDFDDKDPGQFLFPALNLNIDEFSCAIGSKSLAKLDTVRKKRISFLNRLGESINRFSLACRMLNVSNNDSPFFQPVFFDSRRLPCEKVEFARAVKAEGIDINPDYKYVVCEWKWVRPYLADRFVCKNAIAYRKMTFNLLLNENYARQEVNDTLGAILKVEKAYLSNKGRD